MSKRQSLPVVGNCDDCGACCTEQAALPIHLVSSAHFRMKAVSPLPPELEQELRDVTLHFMEHGFPPDGSPCIWYDAEAKRCKHYQHRPTLCRDAVKAGDESCRLWRRKKGIDKQARYTIKNGVIVEGD